MKIANKFFGAMTASGIIMYVTLAVPVAIGVIGTIVTSKFIDKEVESEDDN